MDSQIDFRLAQRAFYNRVDRLPLVRADQAL